MLVHEEVSFGSNSLLCFFQFEKVQAYFHNNSLNRLIFLLVEKQSLTSSPSQKKIHILTYCEDNVN